MSTQIIRNLLNNQVSSVIAKAKMKVKEEGKKNLNKLKKQIPTPQSIDDELKVDISYDSCSPEGKEKFNKKVENIQRKLDSINDALEGGISTLEGLKESLDKVVGPGGVLAKIKEMPQVIEPITTSLNIVVQVASTLITAVGFIPPPATAPAGPQILAKDAAKIASGTVSEFSALITSIPNMIDTYMAKANSVLGIIDTSLKNLLMMKEKVDKLNAYLLFKKLDFESKCDDLLNSGNSGLGTCSCPQYTTEADCIAAGCTWTPNGGDGSGAIIDGNNITNINELTMDQLINATQLIYGNILDNLIQQGDDKAIERIHVMNKEMEEWKNKHNISFKIIYI